MADPSLLLGVAVVKIACKVWLKDNAIAADAAVSAAEIIKSHVSETRERRRLQRFFEDIEEQVADNVLRNMVAEFRGLADNERDAAVLAVADTLDKAKLTTELLFAADLDAAKVVRSVRPAGKRFTRDLSQAATELYDRVLRDCCAHVVEVANALPGFEVGVFGEILARQKELVSHLDQRFDHLPMQLGGAGAETFEQAYRHLVASQLDKVELFGVTVSERVEHYPLSVAYVSLAISAGTSVRSGYERRVTSIEEALANAKRAFIRGEAGSGKTTLLQWLAVRVARRELAGPMRDLNDCVPVLIRLRRYSGTELPAPEDFLHEVGRLIAHTMPMDWVHDLMSTGRALVLVDGVDELPEVERPRVRDWLRQLLISYPNARYVVTSRPTVASASWLDGEAFDGLEIQPMTLSDIDAFIDHWHSAMADGVTDTAERDRISSSRHELTNKIRTQRHLRMLAVSPLMTALICALHLDRRMQLPNDRMELYSIALDMLLERRDTEREIRAADVTIARADKMLLLEDLAYWLVRNGWSSASHDRVLERLTRKLEDMHRVQAEAAKVLKYLLDRTGLLRTPVEGQIDFVHKTFQEFLAARAAVANDDIGALVQNAQDDQWREVVLMAVGHATARQTDELLRQLLAKARRSAPRTRSVIQALTLACIEHVPQLSPRLLGRLHDVAAKLLPPRDVEQAVALAGAGELALELLAERRDYTPIEATATIRMAAAVGGPLALSIISECAKTPGPDVSFELERAWPEFEPEQFAEQILAGAVGLESIVVTDPSLVAGLRHLRLRALSCRFAHGYGDLAYLADLPELIDFELIDPALADLVQVGAHPQLSALDLGPIDQPVDFSPLGRCASLYRIACYLNTVADRHQLGEIDQISSLSVRDEANAVDLVPFLAESLRLQHLSLWWASGMVDLEELDVAQLSALTSLHLRRAARLATVVGIERWASTMTSVTLSIPNEIDVDPLSALINLDYLALVDTPLESLEFTEALGSLERLHIGGDGISVPDLSPLARLAGLRELRIFGDQPVDLSGLAGATDLTVMVDDGQRRVRTAEGLDPTVEVFGLLRP